jgi:soluble lytic murein transglycosylase-like protein
VKKVFVIIFFILVTAMYFASDSDLEIFLKNYMEDFYNVEPKMASTLSETIVKEAGKYGIDPLIVVAVIQQESSFRNVVGDNGEAIGFAQLHQGAVFYVCSFFPDVAEKVRKIGAHKNLLYYPVLQIQIAVRYLFLLQINFDIDIITAIGRYNGQTSYYNTYTTKVLNNYAFILSTFNEYLLVQKK